METLTRFYHTLKHLVTRPSRPVIVVLPPSPTPPLTRRHSYDQECFYCMRQLPHTQANPIIRHGSIRRPRRGDIALSLPYNRDCFICTNRLGFHMEHVLVLRSQSVRRHDRLPDV